MNRISASKLQRALHCRYWARPDVELPPDEVGEAAKEGTRLHEVLRLAHEAPGGEHPQWAIVALSAVGAPPCAQCEVAFAIDPFIGSRALATAGPRDYSMADDDEIAGTADICWVDGDGVGHVVDWKTGDPDNVEPVETNAQLAALAVAFAYVHQLSLVKVSLAFVGPGRTPFVSSYMHDDASLKAWSADLQSVIDGISGALPCSGEWCRWCQAASVCPVTSTALAELDGSKLADSLPMTAAIVSDEHAASVHVRLKLVDKAIADIKKSLKAYVEERGNVPIGNGKALKIVEASRESCTLSKVPKELKEQLRKCGAISVSFYSMQKEVKGK